MRHAARRSARTFPLTAAYAPRGANAGGSSARAVYGGVGVGRSTGVVRAHFRRFEAQRPAQVASGIIGPHTHISGVGDGGGGQPQVVFHPHELRHNPKALPGPPARWNPPSGARALGAGQVRFICCDEGATWAALASCAALARRRRRVYHPIDRASPVAHGAARCQGLLARGQPRGGAANLAGKRRCVGAQRPEGEAL